MNRGDCAQLRLRRVVRGPGHCGHGHFAGRAPFEAIVTVQMLTVTALALATFWWVEKPVFRPTAQAAASIVATGLLATALAFSVQAWAQQYMTVTRAAIIYSLEPVFAVADGFCCGW